MGYKEKIIAHRGMGPSNKRRDKLLPGLPFFPENSKAAFEEAMFNQDADGVECDIHVSSDGYAMVIHGSKIFPYADYIGPNTPLHLMGHDALEVEKFSCKALQTEFALKGGKCAFDNASSEEKRAITRDPYQVAPIVAEKRQLLATDKDYHQIPTLVQLLALMFEANMAREREGKPLLLLNIELKGKGAAIASLGAIREFYQTLTAEQIERFLPPTQLVFLGRCETDEIVIMNDILRGNKVENEAYSGLRLKEIYDTFRQNYTQANQASIGQAFESVEKCKNTMGAILREAGVTAPVPLTMDIVAKVWRQVHGGAEDALSQLQTALYMPYLLATLDEQVERPFLEGVLQEHQAYAANPSGYKTALKKELKPFAKIIDKCNRDFLMPARTAAELLELGLALEWRKEYGLIERQFKQQSWTTDSCLVYAAEHLVGVKTNVMISTGQLFGRDMIVDGGDFDIKTSVREVSMQGLKRVRDVLRGGYNGIDISLFDFTSALVRTIKAERDNAGAKGGDFILGATASNWRGSKHEKAIVDPLFTIKRARRIAEKCEMPLLLKVDESKLFKAKQVLVEREPREPSRSVTAPVVLETSTMTLVPKVGIEIPWEMVQDQSLTNHDPRNLDHIVHNKPPRGDEKETGEVSVPLSSPVMRSYDGGMRWEESVSPKARFAVPSMLRQSWHGDNASWRAMVAQGEEYSPKRDKIAEIISAGSVRNGTSPVNKSSFQGVTL